MTGAQLEGRTAVVAGGGGGIGSAVVRLFAQHGATVHALGRNRQALAAAVPPEFLDSRHVVPHTVDVTDEEVVHECLAGIHDTTDIHVLVSVVGVNVPNRRLGDLTTRDWDAILRSNLDSCFYLIHAALPALRRTSGTGIFIGSASAYWPNGSGAAYQAAKLGLLGLTRAASYDEHTRGVRFTTISPGLVDTPHLARRATPPSATARAASLRPEDVAGACLYIASLPATVHVPEMVMLPTALQAPGKTEIPDAPSRPTSPSS
ncbi:SDR family oxidoreductase [Amycolatopsis sp. K13G38]|uniref:SDR family oxidoreductase n=1 Tax=Amycolatopsis acididurans TaxID=2724524 RepID=A0ABX1JE20_9PSEU|nr:SDR family oxidoreductase [Amycolatopsis acididurans]NKQ58033.1 SDR family oxidoreductase [Amycolatopsis acididurans]